MLFSKKSSTAAGKSEGPAGPSKALLDTYLTAVKSRRSVYTQTSSSGLSGAEVESLVKTALQIAPSPYNSQTFRAIVVDGPKSAAFFRSIKPIVVGAFGDKMGPKLDGFANAQGTIVIADDRDAINAFKEKYPHFATLEDEWAAHSSGMLQYILWAGLAAAGATANLQHLSFMPAVAAEAKKQFGIPEHWDVVAQIVYGGNSSTETLPPKESLPFETTLRVVN